MAAALWCHARGAAFGAAAFLIRGRHPAAFMLRAGLPDLFQEFIGLPFRFGLGDAAARPEPGR